MDKMKGGALAKTAAEMTLREALYSRRSVRSFTRKPVDPAVIRWLLDAAVHAPTAVHEEPWAFAVLQDRTLLKRLSDSAKETLREIGRDVHLPGEKGGHSFAPPEDIFYDAGTMIVIYGKPLGRFVVADCWLAAENLMLAARSLGLGTCVIGLAVNALNSPRWKSELNVPPELTAYSPIIVGFPSGETPPTGRQEPLVLSWKLE